MFSKRKLIFSLIGPITSLTYLLKIQKKFKVFHIAKGL